MDALTIRQPWAHAILHAGKNVEKPNRRPGSVWTLRRPLVRSGSNGSVRTMSDDYIGIGHWGDFRVGPQAMALSRRDARLLAKRINQCLDETRKP